MDKFEEIAKAEQGAMIGLFGQKRRFTIRARSERFVILSKKCFGVALYTIVDFEDEWMGPDYLIFGVYDYCDADDCREALELLEKGELGISSRHGLSFDAYR